MMAPVWAKISALHGNILTPEGKRLLNYIFLRCQKIIGRPYFWLMQCSWSIVLGPASKSKRALFCSIKCCWTYEYERVFGAKNPIMNVKQTNSKTQTTVNEKSARWALLGAREQKFPQYVTVPLFTRRDWQRGCNNQRSNCIWSDKQLTETEQIKKCLGLHNVKVEGITTTGIFSSPYFR